MRMHNRINLGTRLVNRRVDHRLAWRVLEFGDRSLVAGFGIILLANLHVLINRHFDNMFGCDFAEWRQHWLDKKCFGAWYARTDVTVIVGQALVEHDAVAQRDFFLECFEIFLAGFHLSPLSIVVRMAAVLSPAAPTGSSFRLPHQWIFVQFHWSG